MTNVNNILRLAALILTVVFSTSCNNLNLTNEEAKVLITQKLGLPKKVTDNVSGSDIFKWPKLMEAGLIYDPGNCSYGCDLKATEEGAKYLIKDEGEGGYPMEYNTLTFQCYFIDLGDITGIALDKEQQTAVIRFVLKAIDITPAGQAMDDNVNNARNSELIFKKFDNGWQLASELNKSENDLIRELWWGRD